MDIGFNETQRIVVYNSETANVKNKVINVAGTTRSNWNHWELHFSNESIPKTSTLLPLTAFFIVSAWCPSNLYHFWEEEFLGLFSVVNQSNRLHLGVTNQFLYRHPPMQRNYLVNSTKSCHCCEARSRFDNILETLRLAEFHGEFYNLPPNTCFRTAIFGKRNYVMPLRAAVNHVLRSFNLTYISVMKDYSPIVTIIQRTHRRIINIDELVNITRAAGFTQVQIVNFEQMCVREQAAFAAKSQVMVGVQGAGLQWAIFMSPGSTLIEISWPNWNSFYAFVGRYKIRYLKLVKNNALINWNTYEIKVVDGRKLSLEEQQQILISSPTSRSYHNVWKWADVSVNIEDYKAHLKKIHIKIN